jgi:hypothetical protein
LGGDALLNSSWLISITCAIVIKRMQLFSINVLRFKVETALPADGKDARL